MRSKATGTNSKTKEVKEMRFRLMICVFCLAVFQALTLSAFADEKPEIALQLTAQKEIVVKDADGKVKTEWQETASTGPGDVLRYTIQYINKGPADAKEVVINNPVPAGTAYIGSSAEGTNSEITFSIDGKTFQSPPMLKYKVKKADGPEQELTATPDMYTFVRWKLTKPVKPGESGTVSFKVRVR